MKLLTIIFGLFLLLHIFPFLLCSSKTAEDAVRTRIIYILGGKMAESEDPEASSCTFLFKKSTKKFSGRKRKASDSDKGNNESSNECL